MCGESTGDWWIPRTKGQWYGKCFHLMILSSTRPTLSHYHLNTSSNENVLIKELFALVQSFVCVCLIGTIHIPTSGRGTLQAIFHINVTDINVWNVCKRSLTYLAHSTSWIVGERIEVHEGDIYSLSMPHFQHPGAICGSNRETLSHRAGQVSWGGPCHQMAKGRAFTTRGSHHWKEQDIGVISRGYPAKRALSAMR